MQIESPVKRMGPIPKKNFTKPLKGTVEFEILQYNKKGTFSRFQNLTFKLTGTDGKIYTGSAIADQRSGGAIYLRDSDDMQAMLIANQAKVTEDHNSERKDRF